MATLSNERESSQATQILQIHGLRRIADRLCTEENLKTMQDIANLTDEKIDTLSWLKRAQSLKLKSICEACRRGDPDEMDSILDERLAPRAPERLFEAEAVIAELEDHRSRLFQDDFRRGRVQTLLSRMKELNGK